MPQHRDDDIVINTGDLEKDEQILVDRDANGRIWRVRKVSTGCSVVVLAIAAACALFEILI